MQTKISGSFAGTGSSKAVHLFRHFNLSLRYSQNAVATIELQRSFDSGTTWETTDTFTSSISTIALEPEKNVQYRINCSVHSAGTVDYRLGNEGY